MNPIRFDFAVQEVALSQIDWGDSSYRTTFNRPVGTLCRSIEAIGLQHRPVLQSLERGRFGLVSGYRRLKALERMKRPSVLCKTVSRQTEAKELLFFNILENADRGFNTVEQALALKRLSAFVDKQGLIRECLPLLGLPPKEEILSRWMTINDLSPVFWPALVQGKLHPETIETVMGDFFTLAHPILTLFLFFHWSFQKQKEFLSDLKETRIRFRNPVETFLFTPSLLTALQAAEATPGQKGDVWRKILRNLLFPVLTESEQRFRALVAELRLDQKIRLSPPPFFEGGHYELTFRFSTPPELKTSLSKIGFLLEEGKLDGLP
ncbi:MAG: ParB/RepB/Spo0J family partition protein [Thermodesulfobacteriota bacterium]